MPKTKLEICSYSRETRRSAAVIQSQQTGKVMKLQIADAIRDQAGTGEARLPGYGGAVGLLLVRADKEHGLPAVGFHHCAVFLIPRDLKTGGLRHGADGGVQPRIPIGAAQCGGLKGGRAVDVQTSAAIQRDSRGRRMEIPAPAPPARRHQPISAPEYREANPDR